MSSQLGLPSSTPSRERANGSCSSAQRSAAESTTRSWRWPGSSGQCSRVSPPDATPHLPPGPDRVGRLELTSCSPPGFCLLRLPSTSSIPLRRSVSAPLVRTLANAHQFPTLSVPSRPTLHTVTPCSSRPPSDLPTAAAYPLISSSGRHLHRVGAHHPSAHPLDSVQHPVAAHVSRGGHPLQRAHLPLARVGGDQRDCQEHARTQDGTLGADRGAGVSEGRRAEDGRSGGEHPVHAVQSWFTQSHLLTHLWLTRRFSLSTTVRSRTMSTASSRRSSSPSSPRKRTSRLHPPSSTSARAWATASSSSPSRLDARRTGASSCRVRLSSRGRS